MADLRVKKVTLRNWGKFHEAEVEFPEYGLVMVSGINAASGGTMQSVGCHAKGQLVITASGKSKAVEDVRVFDRLIGPDSKPRHVMRLCRGNGAMFRVVPKKGRAFVVNEDHVLALYFTNSPKYPYRAGERFTVTVRDFLQWPLTRQRECKLYRAGHVNFRKSTKKLLLPPRILGMWLGDGNSNDVALTTASPVIEHIWKDFGSSSGLDVREVAPDGNKSKTIYLHTKVGGNKRLGTKKTYTNTVLDSLIKLGVRGWKHIPTQYKSATREARLELLAGLLDTDGNVNNNCFTYTSSIRRLAEDVAHVANSVGFFATVKPVKKRCQTGAVCQAYLVSLIGDGSVVPTFIKHCSKRLQKKNPLVTGFRIEPVGNSEFYGFTLDQDGLYLLDDFTVTHNSGKTIFGESFSRALMGIRGRFEHLKKFSRDKAGDTYVCVEADLLGKPLKVEMGFQCEEINPRAEGLRFQYDNGPVVERGLVAQTRTELVKLIGVPPLLATWTVFVNGKKMDFTQLEQSQSVDLVMSALRQPPWSEYHERVKVYRRKFNKTLSQDEGKHEQCVARVKESQEEVDEAKTQVEEAQLDYDDAKTTHDTTVKRLNGEMEVLLEKLEPVQKRQQELTKEMTRLENEKAADHHKLEIQQRELQECIRKLKQDNAPLLEAQTAAQQRATVAHTNYSNYKSAKRTCPTCKQALGDKLDEKHLSDLKGKYDAAAQKQEEAQGKYDDAVVKVGVEETELEGVNASITALGVKYGITELSEEFEENAETLNQGGTEYRQREATLKRSVAPATSVLDAAKTKLEERKRVLVKAKEARTVAAEALAVSQATEKVMDYWSTAFSPYGIPNMVLREAIAPLNHEARRISASMTGGTIEVVYSTMRELAGGEEKAQLNIEVNNLLGSQDLEGSSNGEAGLTNYIISETLSNVGQVSRRIGYRWYDEIVPHQDPKVCHSIYSYWKELAQKLKILILMVDHNPIAANYADYFLVIQKSGKPGDVVGTVYWR